MVKRRNNTEGTIQSDGIEELFETWKHMPTKFLMMFTRKFLSRQRILRNMRIRIIAYKN